MAPLLVTCPAIATYPVAKIPKITTTTRNAAGIAVKPVVAYAVGITPAATVSGATPARTKASTAGTPSRSRARARDMALGAAVGGQHLLRARRGDGGAVQAPGLRRGRAAGRAGRAAGAAHAAAAAGRDRRRHRPAGAAGDVRAGDAGGRPGDLRRLLRRWIFSYLSARPCAAAGAWGRLWGSCAGR